MVGRVIKKNDLTTICYLDFSFIIVFLAVEDIKKNIV